MNTFGEFLYELRKEKGMTQAELADRLGVTNKAVSKWETGEAMPETSLLVPLAEIFGVTVDELLNGKRAQSTNSRAEKADASETIKDHIKDHIFTRGKDDEPETLGDKICGVICAVLSLGGFAAYIFVGVFTNLWHPYWLITAVCALSCGIVGIIFNLCDKQKRAEAYKKGKNPYTDGACGIIILSCIIAYLFCGALANLWHPYWVIIVTGVVVDGVVGAIGKCFVSKNKD